jgi:hypothetical protein
MVDIETSRNGIHVKELLPTEVRTKALDKQRACTRGNLIALDASGARSCGDKQLHYLLETKSKTNI